MWHFKRSIKIQVLIKCRVTSIIAPLMAFLTRRFESSFIDWVACVSWHVDKGFSLFLFTHKLVIHCHVRIMRRLLYAHMLTARGCNNREGLVPFLRKHTVSLQRRQYCNLGFPSHIYIYLYIYNWCNQLSLNSDVWTWVYPRRGWHSTVSRHLSCFPS